MAWWRAECDLTLSGILHVSVVCLVSPELADLSDAPETVTGTPGIGAGGQR
jgi:hypothetical protein